MDADPYKRLAERLDALPNGYPATPDGTELRILALLFTTEQAELATKLRLTPETPDQIATRTDGDPAFVRRQLKDMVRQGLITSRRIETGLGYAIMPFVVGIYEAQAGRLSADLARLFEEYYREAFGQMFTIQPSVHRVIPVNESVRSEMEIRPYESVREIVDNAQSWGVMDCICRTQKTLVGDPCGHPVEMCMVFSRRPGAFKHNPVIRSLTHADALKTLRSAVEAGLVHSVSNNQKGTYYVCNCCTCSCGILRGMAEMGIANAVARSAFVNQVDVELCLACEDCLESCQFDALALDGQVMQVDGVRCVGCGVCVPNCPEEALGLVRRPEEEILAVPETEADWMQVRAAARGQNIAAVL